MTLTLFSSPKSKSSTLSSPLKGNDHDSTNAAKHKRRQKEAGDYWLGKTLGKGSSSRVKLGYHKISGEKVAVKIISKTYLRSNASTEKAVKQEIAIMKLIQHPHIVRLIDVIDAQGSPNLYLILEYVQGGELFEQLISKGRLSEKGARKYFRQIIFAVDFCHRHLICHRDLKPENLLLDDAFNIKIADFGMASLQPRGTLLETSCGSPHYSSPEIVMGIPYNGSASDIWSCGVILYALLCGRLPFDDDNMRELLCKVKRGKYSLPDSLSDSAKDLLRKMLVVRPDKRLTMQQIQDHEWFKMDGLLANPSTNPRRLETDQIAMAIQDPSSIDERLLETLKTLWVGHSKEQLVDALMSRMYNMEKVAYHLLQQHSTTYWQTKYLENQDDGPRPCQQATSDSSTIGKMTPRQRRPTSICTSDLPSSVTLETTSSCGIGNEFNNLIPPPSPNVQRSCFLRKHTIDSVVQPAPQQLSNLQRESSSLRSCTVPLTSVTQNQSLLNDPSFASSNNTSQPKRMSLLANQYHERRVLHLQQTHSPHIEEMNQLIRDQELVIRQPSPGQTRLRSLLQRMDLHYGSSNDNSIPSQLLSPKPSASPTTRKIKNRLSIPMSKKSSPNDTSFISSNTTHPIDQQQAIPRTKPYHIEARPSHPLMFSGSPSLTSKACVAPSSPRLKTPTIDTPKLSSWFPGLSHIKRPKILTINCTANDYKEAFGKVTQVIRERLNGSHSEEMATNGIIQSQGIIDISFDQEGGWRSQKVRFRLEYDPSLNHLPARKVAKGIKINFIQQQGDTAVFLRAIKLVEKALDEYEKEAEFVSMANGWNIYRS